MLSRKIFAPLRMRDSIMLTLSVAGPRVTRIFVLRMMVEKEV
jgi:hypothetical protein